MTTSMHAPGCQPNPDRDPYVGCECGATIRPYTPTEAEVRGGYVRNPMAPDPREFAEGAFDRFLAQVRAEARREGAAEALRAWVDEWPTTPGDGTFLADVARAGRARADQITREGGQR